MTDDIAPDTSVDLTRSEKAKAALAAWANVRPDQLPADKMWTEHPGDLNRQAWDRVIAAIENPWVSRTAALEAGLKRLLSINDVFAKIDHREDRPTDAQVKEWWDAMFEARRLVGGRAD